jgi:sulfatase maturation enzyme AslB (radical SAM superfamily)
MQIVNFTIQLTEECNYSCTYCYQKKKEQIGSNLTRYLRLSIFYTHFLLKIAL